MNLKSGIQRRLNSSLSRLSHLVSAESDSKFFYVSHHKCATQYVMRVVNDVCARLRYPTVKADWREPIGQKAIQQNKFILIQDHGPGIIDFDKVEGKGFHVIRDPRDILVSLYFSHRDSHIVSDPRAFAAFEQDPNSALAEILRNREKLPTLSLEDGLSYLLDTSHYFSRIMQTMSDWDYDSDRFYETRFERITTDSQTEFANIFNFLGMGVDSAALSAIVEKHSFKTLKQTRANSGEDLKNHYRKGQAGDWVNHLTGAAREKFDSQYGSLVTRLGYS